MVFESSSSACWQLRVDSRAMVRSCDSFPALRLRLGVFWGYLVYKSRFGHRARPDSLMVGSFRQTSCQGSSTDRSSACRAGRSTHSLPRFFK